jgi:hypothetical protein
MKKKEKRRKTAGGGLVKYPQVTCQVLSERKGSWSCDLHPWHIWSPDYHYCDSSPSLYALLRVYGGKDRYEL